MLMYKLLGQATYSLQTVLKTVVGGHVHASKLYSSIFQGVSWAMFRFMSHFLAAARKHWLVVSWRWWALGSSFDEIRLDLKKTTNCWLSVTASSLTHLLPISQTSQCTRLPGSFILLQAHWYFESFMLEQTPLANTVSPTMLQSKKNLLSYDVHHIQSSHAFKIVLKTHLYKQYHNDSKFHLFTCLPPPRYPPLLLTFLLCACVDVRACVKTILRLYHYFWGFTVYILVDVVKHNVLTLVGHIQCYRNDSYYYIPKFTSLTHTNQHEQTCIKAHEQAHVRMHACTHTPTHTNRLDDKILICCL